MEENQSLQKTLREKYNINEKLMAEGTFVGLIGDHAANLVRLGLGSSCVVVARLVLSGEELDYDVLSLTPLSVLSLTFQNSSKKILIRSQFQPTQVYQQCTSAIQAEVWDNFTSIIKEVYASAHGDIWIHTPLKTADKQDHIRHSLIEVEHSYTRPNPYYYDNRSFSQSHQASTAFCEDFDSFVNDVPTQFSDYDPNYLPCKWNGSGDGMVQLNNIEQNKSNNAITQDMPYALEQSCRLQKFFRKILGCCGIMIK